jgi:WD40 repeat protein
MYVHHDIMLPSLPLCVEWLNYNVNTSAEDDGTRRGNMVAVGTFDPDIEVWDLDMVESMYPDAILGAAADKGKNPPAPGKKGKKKKKKPRVNDQYHVDAVMCLSANRLQRNLLLSGSADTTVKLWDLTNGSSSSCVKSFSFHSDKVSAIQWHPKEAFYALTGSYDRYVTVTDFRTADGKGAKWKFDSDIEGVKWDPHDTNFFYVSPHKNTSNRRSPQTTVSYITTTSECIPPQNKKQYGYSKPTTQESRHSTYHPPTQISSSLDPPTKSSNYGTRHRRNKDLVWSSPETWTSGKFSAHNSVRIPMWP